jgi:hypothetical protein
MDDVKAARQVMRLDDHEGSLLYTDAHGRDGVRAMAALTVAVYHDPVNQGRMAIAWCPSGYLPATIEALAAYYMATPGLKDSVDGMYKLLLEQRRVGLPEPDKR